MTRKIGKILVYSLAAITIFTLAIVLMSPSTTPSSFKAFAPVPAIDAAFQDGLYIGKLDARQGRNPHFAVGRWARNPDRDSFVRGYQQGYENAVQEYADKMAGQGSLSWND